MIEEQGLYVDTLRVRGFPFSDEVFRFIEAHPHTFVVEQNRDAQLKTLLMVEGQIDPARLVSVLHYDGTPITAKFISHEIAARMTAANVTPIKKVGT